MEKKNYKPWLATTLSFVYAGIGHLYLGEWKKGLMYLIIETIIFYLYLTYPSLDAMILVSMIISIYASYDAYNLALDKTNKEKNKPIEKETKKEYKIY